MEILPGIHQFKAPLEGLELDHINIYVLEGPKGNIIIDTGWNAPGVWEGLLADFKSAGLKLEDISDVVVTHIHTDHYGLASRFKEVSGARLIWHAREQDLILKWFGNSDAKVRDALEFMGKHGLTGEPEKSERIVHSYLGYVSGMISADWEISDGEVISNGAFDLRSMWTPGHSSGHICLYDARKKLLFSGDHVLPHITPHIGAYPQNSPNPLGDFVSSLRRVRDIPVELVLPAHGEPFRHLAQRVDELLHHHEERGAEILSVMKDGSQKTAFDIATVVIWLKDFGGRPFSELGHMDQRLALAETISHLELLNSEGQVCRIQDNGHIKYMLIDCRQSGPVSGVAG